MLCQIDTLLHLFEEATLVRNVVCVCTHASCEFLNVSPE